MDTDKKEGILLSLLASFCAGCTPIFSKLLLEYFSPGLTLSIRMLVSIAILYLMMKAVVKTQIVVSFKTVVIAFFGSLNFVFFIFAIQYIPAHISPVFYCLVPIEVTLLSFLIFKQGCTVKEVVGILVGYVGAVIVVFPSLESNGHEGIKPIGLVLIVLASLSIALYNLFIQVSDDRYSPYNMSFQSIAAAGIISVPALFATDGLHSVKPFNPVVLLYFLGIALIGTIGQYVILQIGISKIKVSANVVFFYFQPIFVLVMSVVFLGEKVRLTYFVGLAIVLVGSSLNLLGNKPRSEEIIEMS